jgi:hypothetical protein
VREVRKVSKRWYRTTFHEHYTLNAVYEIRGSKVHPTTFHEHYTPNALYEIRGSKVHPTTFHWHYTPNAVYEIRGSKVYRTTFHEHYYPERRVRDSLVETAAIRPSRASPGPEGCAT